MKLQIKIEGTLTVDPAAYGLGEVINEEEMDTLRSQIQTELEEGEIELTELDYEPFTIEVAEATE